MKKDVENAKAVDQVNVKIESIFDKRKRRAPITFFSIEELNGSLDRCIEFLQKIKSDSDKNKFTDFDISFSTYSNDDGDPYCDVEIGGYRLETDTEYGQRLQSHAQSQLDKVEREKGKLRFTPTFPDSVPVTDLYYQGHSGIQGNSEHVGEGTTNISGSANVSGVTGTPAHLSENSDLLAKDLSVEVTSWNGTPVKWYKKSINGISGNQGKGNIGISANTNESADKSTKIDYDGVL